MEGSTYILLSKKVAGEDRGSIITNRWEILDNLWYFSSHILQTTFYLKTIR